MGRTGEPYAWDGEEFRVGIHVVELVEGMNRMG